MKLLEYVKGTTSDDTSCYVCSDPIRSGDKCIDLVRDAEYGIPELGLPDTLIWHAHRKCAFNFPWVEDELGVSA